MPIYEYRCNKCGLEKEYLQKISDAPISACPCGESTMTKLISAAGFQLKGSGWYATDFKNGGAKPAAKKDEAASPSSTPTPSEGGESKPKEAASGGSTASGPSPTTS